jgi:hypothetical protein
VSAENTSSWYRSKGEKILGQMEFVAVSTLLVDGNEGCSRTWVQTAGEGAAQLIYEPKCSVELSVIGSIGFVFACLQFYFSSLLVSSTTFLDQDM